jgi:DnaJ-class molecular chaperone
MGMDVFGKEPTGEVGEYFRASVWSWHPLATFLYEEFPELCVGCRNWHSNDGDGLDAVQSKALAAALTVALESGQVGDYVSRRDAELAAMPDLVCTYCNGTGVRTDEVGKKHGLDKPGGCNACSGKGKVRPSETMYSLSVERITAFRDFLQACGGFEIL